MISIADAKNRLPALVHQAEAGQPVTISRRGRPVAVVLSADEYARLQRAANAAPSWMARLDDWRAGVPADLEGLRADELGAGRGEPFMPRVDFGGSGYTDAGLPGQILRAAESAPPYPARRRTGKKNP